MSARFDVDEDVPHGRDTVTHRVAHFVRDFVRSHHGHLRVHLHVHIDEVVVAHLAHAAFSHAVTPEGGGGGGAYFFDQGAARRGIHHFVQGRPQQAPAV